MITENRVSKYVLYAIGEIALVMIGILLALQVNNWNETRKLRVNEEVLLTELKSNLEATLLIFQADTTYNAHTLVHLNRIHKHITEDLPYSSELDSSFGMLPNWASPYPILTGYKTLQTKGIDLISNVALRNSIVNLYEFEYLVLNTDYDRAEWNLSQSIIYPMYAKHIRKNNRNRRLARPNDFEQLKKNDEFSNILGMIMSLRKGGLRSYMFTMGEIHQVIQGIDDELDSRSNDN